MKNIRLGDVLIEFGYITPDQLNTALAYQKEHRDLRVARLCRSLATSMSVRSWRHWPSASSLK